MHPCICGIPIAAETNWHMGIIHSNHKDTLMYQSGICWPKKVHALAIMLLIIGFKYSSQFTVAEM